MCFSIDFPTEYSLVPPRAEFFIGLCHGSIQLVQLMPHRQHLYVLYDLSGYEQLGLNRPDC